MQPPFDTLLHSIVSTGTILVREAGRLFRPHGVSVVQFNTLQLLARAEGGLRPSEISETLVVEASSITYLLDQMETKGWISRTFDKRDRRATKIALTREGRHLHRVLLPIYEAALSEIARTMPRSWEAPIRNAMEHLRQTVPSAVETTLRSTAKPSST